MKKCILSLMFIALLVINITTVFAQNATISANVETCGESVTVTGSISTGKGKQITIYVTDSNNKIAYINQIESGENGTFAITFGLPNTAIEGKYNLSVGGTDVNSPARLIFTYNKNSIPTERIKFIDGDINVNINGYVPSISGTVYCSEGKTITLNITNITDNTIIASETINSENGVFDLSYTLPSFLSPKAYSISIFCNENEDVLGSIVITVDSSILALNIDGTVNTADNVEIEAQLQSVNTGLLDNNTTFKGSETVSATIPNLLSNASFHLKAQGYEMVPITTEDPEPEPKPDPEPEPEPNPDDNDDNFENAAEITVNSFIYGLTGENSRKLYSTQLTAETEYSLYINNDFSYKVYKNNNSIYEPVEITNDKLLAETSDTYYIEVEIPENTEFNNYLLIIKEISDIYASSNVYIPTDENQTTSLGYWHYVADNSVTTSSTGTLFNIKYADCLYYSNMYDSGKLYRLNLIDNIQEKICEDSVAWLYVKDGYIYYKNISNGGSLYKLPVDTEYTITGELAE